MIRFGSVCSGIEAASIAFAPLGWAAAWLAEVDVAASAVLAYRLGATAPVYPLDPDEPGLSLEDRNKRLTAIRAASKMTWGDRITNYGDFTKLVDLVRSGDAEAPDALVGGTPCQAFSLAGRRQGMKDARGGLTLAFVDLADAIDDIRTDRGDEPCIIMWENVPGVLSDKGNAFGCFLAAIAGEDEPLVPSGRKWTNTGFVLGPKRAVAWRIGDAQYFGLAQRRRRIIVVASAREGFDPGRVLFEFDGVRRDIAPSRETGEEIAGTLTSSASRCSADVDDVRDNRVCVNKRPGHSVQLTGYRMTAFGEYADDDSASTLKARDYKDATDLVVYPTLEQAIAFSCKDYGGDATDDLAPTMRAMGHADSHANAGGQIAVCVTGSVTHTLKADGFDGSEDGTGRGQPIVNTATMAVRRLMPVECERLQGFPDGWTLVPVGKKLAADGPRYKQLGNSWVTKHIAWVGRRLDAEIKRCAAVRPTLIFDYDSELMIWALASC